MSTHRKEGALHTYEEVLKFVSPQGLKAQAEGFHMRIREDLILTQFTQVFLTRFWIHNLSGSGSQSGVCNIC